MRVKTVLLQNIVLILGVICIYKFFSLKQFFGLIESWKKFQQPVIDGDGIGITFLGVAINDDGIHWTDIMSYANTFLIVGIALLIISMVIIIWNTKKKTTTAE